MSAWGEEDTVAVDHSLERTTEFRANADGTLDFSTSSTPGVEIIRVSVNGVRVTNELDEEEYEAVMDALYDAGYSS